MNAESRTVVVATMTSRQAALVADAIDSLLDEGTHEDLTTEESSALEELKNTLTEAL